MTDPFFDMHCHLDFAPNAHDAAVYLDNIGAGAFSATVAPSDYESACAAVADCPCVRVGVGLHPWWIEPLSADVAEQVEYAKALIAVTPFVGEVGLDFSSSHIDTGEQQKTAFREIARTCAMAGDKVLTIHAVRSTDAVLDILDECKTFDSCTCILHWYSDSSQALTRALRAGCYISLGAMSLATKRGGEYAKAIPVKRLLLETDYPAQGDSYDAFALQLQLYETAQKIAFQRSEDVGELAEHIRATSQKLLNL